MKVTKRERSVLPVYAIGGVWLIVSFLGGLRSPVGYITAAVLSAAVYFVLKSVFPDKMVEIEVPEPEPADPELAALKKERDNAIAEMKRLNASIADPDISAQIDHIEQCTGKIFDYVMQEPSKKTVIRRFLDYYLPTTLKLLNQYARMDSLGVEGQNITAAKEKIRTMLSTVTASFDKQLDSLFQDDYMDISAEISVLDQMMKQEGISSAPSDGPTLTL